MLDTMVERNAGPGKGRGLGANAQASGEKEGDGAEMDLIVASGHCETVGFEEGDERYCVEVDSQQVVPRNPARVLLPNALCTT
jgi:hypothetical protein